jgi:uncharacterized protein involved in outer membrane biogenesis
MKTLFARLFRAKIVRWMVAVPLLFGLIGYLAVPPIAKYVLTQHVSEKLHRQISIREIVVHPYALSAYVRGFALKERDGSATAASFDELYFNLEAISLLRGNLILSETRLTNPYVRLVRNPDRRYNFTDLIEEFLNQPDEEPKTRFALNNIQLTGGKIDFDDRPLNKRHQVSDIRLAIPFISNLPSYTDIYVHPAFEARVNGRHIALSGKTRPFGDKIEATLELDADDLDLPKYLGYLPRQLPFKLASGLLDTRLIATFARQHGKPPSLQVSGNATLKRVEVDDLAAKPSAPPFFTLASATIKDARLNLDKRTLEIGEFATSGGKLNLRREHDGSLDLAKLAGAAPQKIQTEKGGAAWVVSLKKLAVHDYGIRFEDHLPEQPVTLTGDPISFTAENLSTAKGSQTKLNLVATLNKTGSVTADGTLTLAPLQANLKLDAKNIDMVALQPYFTEKLNVTVTRGAISTLGNLDFAAPNHATFRGSANLADFHVIDKTNAADLLKWKSLYIGGIQTGSAPFQLAIDEIALSDFYSRLIVNADGKLNLQQLVRTAPAQPATAAKPSPSPDPTIRVGKLTLQGGNINFSDRHVKPNFSANLTDIGGRVAGLSSKSGSAADVDLRGRLDSAAPLEIVGKINPLGKDLFVDLKASVKGVELSPFSPYSGKYAGYAIEKGKLSLVARYHIENRKLEAENGLFLDQLTFGERIESPDATRLPVLLALALLKNRNGEIDLHLPIGGSLDDPQFSMGGLIVEVIGNLLTKAITAPFALLGSLFGGGEELSYLEFAPGRQAIDASGEAKLNSLAKALNDRPALELDITGRVDPTLDNEGLKQAILEQKVRVQKLFDLTKRGSAPASLDEIKIDAAEYPALLKRAYQQENFPKPRNMLWLTKDLPVAEMEKLMLTHIAPSADDLRDLANRRATAARDWLLKIGQVAPERIFLVAPKLAPDEEQTKAKASRVDFALR